MTRPRFVVATAGARDCGTQRCTAACPCPHRRAAKKKPIQRRRSAEGAAATAERTKARTTSHECFFPPGSSMHTRSRAGGPFPVLTSCVAGPPPPLRPKTGGAAAAANITPPPPGRPAAVHEEAPAAAAAAFSVPLIYRSFPLCSFFCRGSSEGHTSGSGASHPTRRAWRGAAATTSPKVHPSAASAAGTRVRRV